FVGIEVAGDAEIAAVVAAGEADTGLRIRSGAATDHGCADGKACEKTGHAGSGSAGSWLTGEEVACAGVADARRVEKARREDVGLFEAEDLFAKIKDVGAEWIGGSCGDVASVIDRVDSSERIFLRKDVIDAERAEIFADGLERAAENFGDAIEIGRACRSDG